MTHAAEIIGHILVDEWCANRMARQGGAQEGALGGAMERRGLAGNGPVRITPHGRPARGPGRKGPAWPRCMASVRGMSQELSRLVAFRRPR